MKNLSSCLLICVALFSTTVSGKEYHVSVNGNDTNKGTQTRPFRTINHAAQLALPGDTITVHTGEYREWVNPARGGESDSKRIVYRAAKNEKVAVKGSEVVTGWVKYRQAKGFGRSSFRTNSLVITIHTGIQ